jgi:hypothetical protein
VHFDDLGTLGVTIPELSRSFALPYSVLMASATV